MEGRGDFDQRELIGALATFHFLCAPAPADRFAQLCSGCNQTLVNSFLSLSIYPLRFDARFQQSHILLRLNSDRSHVFVLVRIQPLPMSLVIGVLAENEREKCKKGPLALASERRAA